jgi:hypothetical protein
MRTLEVIDRELKTWEQRAKQTRRDGPVMSGRGYSSRMAAIYDQVAVLWAERARVLERADDAAAGIEG